MLIAGCDPGRFGALALLDSEGPALRAIIDMPSSPDGLLLAELVADVTGALDGRRVAHLFVERQQAFAGSGNVRKMGVSSAKALGEYEMAIRMMAACFGWPVTRITSPQWKKHFRLNADKGQAIRRAGELLPQEAGRWTVRRGHCTKPQAEGRAESALIAIYGFHTVTNIPTGEAPAFSEQL